MKFDPLIQLTISGTAAPTLERHFIGPTPGTPAQYNMTVWRYLDDTSNAEVEIPGEVPLQAFQPRHMDAQRGMVHVYTALDSTSGRMGLNVTVGPGVGVVCSRVAAGVEIPDGIQVPSFGKIIRDGAVDVLEGHGRVQENPSKQSPSLPSTEQVPACSGLQNGRIDR